MICGKKAAMRIELLEMWGNVCIIWRRVADEADIEDKVDKVDIVYVGEKFD